jgi:hypothetical protein
LASALLKYLLKFDVEKTFLQNKKSPAIRRAFRLSALAEIPIHGDPASLRFAGQIWEALRTSAVWPLVPLIRGVGLVSSGLAEPETSEQVGTRGHCH